MTNKEFLKKKIIYIATHRGAKEMDLLLGNFVRDNINNLKARYPKLNIEPYLSKL